MKKRLLMALAAGAMVAAMVPGVASAEGAGTVTGAATLTDLGSSSSGVSAATSPRTEADVATEAIVTTSTATSSETETSSDSETTDATDNLDVGLFFEGALEEEVTTEDCTLSGGAETTCYRITVAGFPASHDVGPFCPETITDGADAGGLWFDGNAVYDLDGEFIVGLAGLYEDDAWRMYDEDGNVFVTETAEEFEAAARPDVDPALQNHCVEGRLEWLENGEPIPTTVLIPVEPVAADTPGATQGNLGVTLDGVVIAQSAPVDAILSAHTIAAFDDCGAHFNPFDGYHLHGAVGCSELEEASEGETPMFGYAMDGHPIHSPLDDSDSADLDECNGHTTDADGYHYHANGAEENLVIECLVGQTVAGAAGDDGAGERPAGPPPGGDGGDRPEGPPPGEG